MENSTSTRITFAVTTLGCKVNQADSEAIGEQMSAAGFVQQDFNDAADIYIVNTCTVTHLGDRSSRQLISQAHRRHPDALLVVTGCYAEMNPKAVAALAGVDLVVGNRQKDSLAEVIKNHWNTDTTQMPQMPQLVAQDSTPYSIMQNGLLQMLPQHIGSDQSFVCDNSVSDPQPDNLSRLSPFTDGSPIKLTSRTRVQMKVQDGCNNRCTYCIVPYVRGSSHSRSTVSVVENVQRKARAGFQEVVLTGIHLGDYHPDADKKHDLGDLIAALLRDTDIPRIRVSSLEPEDFQMEWLELWQNPRMCRHLHLPMQSGSDAVLRRMARRYNSARYHDIITSAKRLVPGIAISTDIITGFPGESENDFEQTYQLAAELQFAKAHVFRYSSRQGTAAARMKGQIHDEVKKARSERLLELNEKDGRRFRQEFLGQNVEVLLESCKHGRWEGLTDNYLRVELENLPDAQTHNWQNTLVKAQLTELINDGISGIFIK